MKKLKLLSLCALLSVLSACGRESDEPLQYGPDPTLPEPHRGLLPTMKIADPAPWGEKRPRAPQGYSVTAIATNLEIPRQTLVLPNGDILVAEGRGGAGPTPTPKGFIFWVIKARGGTHPPHRKPLDLAPGKKW